MKSHLKLIFTGILFSMASAAHALTSTGSFTISYLYISLAENYHVRVYGFPQITACINGPSWAYINTSQPGSKDYIAALMISYANKQSVNLVVQPDGYGYCQIIEMSY